MLHARPYTLGAGNTGLWCPNCEQTYGFELVKAIEEALPSGTGWVPVECYSLVVCAVCDYRRHVV